MITKIFVFTQTSLIIKRKKWMISNLLPHLNTQKITADHLLIWTEILCRGCRTDWWSHRNTFFSTSWRARAVFMCHTFLKKEKKGSKGTSLQNMMGSSDETYGHNAMVIPADLVWLTILIITTSDLDVAQGDRTNSLLSDRVVYSQWNTRTATLSRSILGSWIDRAKWNCFLQTNYRIKVLFYSM